MKQAQTKKMMNGAAVLTGAAFISKLLSAVYKVPFQNLTGNEGFYVYQQVYPFYGLALALSLNGLPVFLSKVIAEQEEATQKLNVLKKTTLILSVIAIILFIGTQFGAGMLAEWMGDPLLRPMIQSVSWMYLFIPVLAGIRGFFQGNLKMMPTALSQVSEQVVRVTVILLAAFLFYRSNESVYEMGTLAFHSAWLSASAASLVLLFFFGRQMKRDRKTPVAAHESSYALPPTYQTLAKRVATEGVTISMIGSLMILFQLIDSFTVYNGLRTSGLLKGNAIDMKGIYDRGQPLVQLGLVVSVGLASSLLPLLRMQFATKQRRFFLRTSRSILRLTAVFASAASVGLVAVMPYLNEALFEDRAGTGVLQVFVFAVLGMSLVSAYNAILQSMDEHRLVFGGIVFAVAIKLIGNRVLVPAIGTMGSSLSTVASLFLMYQGMKKLAPPFLHTVTLDWDFLVRLTLALAGMFGTVRVSLSLFGSVFSSTGRTGALLLTVMGGAIGVSVYSWLLFRLHVLTIREWLSIPFGKQLMRGRVKK